MRGMDGYMRGVNLGGWLSQFDAPTKEHFDTFITEDDIRRIAGLGLDHVRVPVDYTLRKHVKKPGGAPAGFVIYTNQKTAVVSVSEAEIAALAKR